MVKYDPGTPLISIHIPKCAGTAFKDVLKAWFGRRLLSHYFNEKTNQPPKKHNLMGGLINKRYKSKLCIHGHFTWRRKIGVRDYYPDIHQYITVLRDPFEVHLSNYFYIKRLGDDAYRNGKQQKFADNGYDVARYLKENRKSFILDFLPPHITMENYREVLEKEFVHIGIAEDLQATVDALARRLGFPTRTVPVKNTSPRKEEVPSGLREEFIKNNPLEMAIYEYALEHYKE